jgi:uncharacterized damage-inducible protein DinB
MSFGFVVETYSTERLKTLSVWAQFLDAELEFRPSAVSRSVREQFVHQCASEDAWFTKMLGLPVPVPVLPPQETRLEFLNCYAEASGRRLTDLESQPSAWFEAPTSFFAVERSRAWVLLRRIAHTAHHRGQLTTYHRLLEHTLHSTYGPTADTGGLPVNGARVIYRYPSVEALLAGERAKTAAAPLPGPGTRLPTERPPEPA